MTNRLKFTWAAVCRIMLFACAAVLTACSGGGDRDSDALRRQTLTIPIRVTLTTPSTVAPLTPAVVGSSSLRLGANAEITSGLAVAMGSGGVAAEPDAILNETWSRGTATLRDRVRLRGTLHAKTRLLGNGVVVPTWDQNPPFDPAQTLAWTVTYPTGTESNFTLNSGEIGSIIPGKWATVTLNSSTVLMLTAGTYYLKDLVVQSGATIKLDQTNGPIIIYVSDSLQFRGGFQSLPEPEPRVAVVYLGITATFIEKQFTGALVAPSAQVTLRAVSGVHTGYFYAKDLVLDAGARVKYQTPIALIGVAAPTPSKCRELLGPEVPPSEVSEICPGCVQHIDSDRDGFEDCVDECPSDPAKVTPGRCDCNMPETDTDGDGTPDCIDRCDLDRNNTSPGQCGCSSSDPNIRAPQPAGTQCLDTACPPANATCNGSGVCGNPAACLPATTCKLVRYARSAYWVCPGPVTQSAALTACRNKQATLVRVDGFAENTFLRNHVSAPVWIGANSITTSGTWRWSNATGNQGEQFWSGAVAGAQANSLYSSWAPGAPAAQRCAAVQADGSWVDVDCSQALGFVCEYTAPLVKGPVTPLPGGPRQPPAPLTCSNSPSYPEESPAGYVKLKNDVLAQQENPPRFVGSGADRPADTLNNCVNDDGANAITRGEGPDEGCVFRESTAPPADFTCFDDSDCAAYDATLTCRSNKIDSSCEPSPEKPCLARPRCGTLTCPPPAAANTACQQFDLCTTGDVFTPAVPADQVAGVQFKPADLFGGAVLPPAKAAEQYEDPPVGSGKQHSWCSMKPQQLIPDATKPPTDKQREAGSSTPISFYFNPDLQFEANVNPLALGESDLKVHAGAELKTGVTFRNFLNLPTFSVNILSAVASITAERCSVRDDLDLRLFGGDSVDLGIDTFDTGTSPEAVRCSATLSKFTQAANRAKKAFRDAQQLLDQYNKVKCLGQYDTTNCIASSLRNLCPTLMATLGPGASIPYFPDGLTCPYGEPPEITINRFIDFYQTPGFGEVSLLRDAASELRDATAALKLGWKSRTEFGPKPKGESVTLVNAQFWIGPVPVTLELEAYYSYGIAGFFDLALDFPIDPFSDKTVTKAPVATVNAGVMPYANAGLTAFVGAGGTLGPISGSVGVEGAVTIGDAKAPIFAGAGVVATVTKDERKLPGDIEKLATVTGLGAVTHFGLPKDVKFSVWYNYGAALQVSNVLKGTINARLRVKFAFFSRTWRKRVVEFRGMPDIEFNLVSGKAGTDPAVATSTESVDYPTKSGAPVTGSTRVVQGTTDVGYSEPQVPLVVLEPLEVPEGNDDDPSSGVDFDTTKLGSVLYDNLCCASLSDPVVTGEDQCAYSRKPSTSHLPSCCAGTECFPTDEGTRCQEPECMPEGGSCREHGCCSPASPDETSECIENVCVTRGT
jgi:hypothetical protein